MPELPEVETTAAELNLLVKGKVLKNLWVEHKPMLRRPKARAEFLRVLQGEKVLKVGRRGKIVRFWLTNAKNLFVHQKLSGHLMYGRWVRRRGGWRAADEATTRLMADPYNRFLRLVFSFADGSALALSDIRKFGRAYAVSDESINAVPELRVGADPLCEGFEFKTLKPLFASRAVSVKHVLLDQAVIAGIGNIYADEILWRARISPLKSARDLLPAEYARIGKAIPFVLKRALALGGTSIDNYRRPGGALGGYQDARAVYRKEGKPCPRCGSPIMRVKMGQRSTHYCPQCQK
jgi:formamidopyrimidine-DNA glycosylase